MARDKTKTHETNSFCSIRYFEIIPSGTVPSQLSIYVTTISPSAIPFLR